MTPESSNTIGQTSNTGAGVPPSSCSLSPLLIYGLGECAVSLVMNSIFAFAMLYYTRVLKLDPSWAGIAMSLSVF